MNDLMLLQKRALEIKQRYREMNSKKGHHVWSGRDYAMGLVGDLGYLIKVIMAKESMRHIDDVNQKLNHELADCLWSILVLADHYNIDLKQSFLSTMDELDMKIDEAMK